MANFVGDESSSVLLTELLDVDRIVAIERLKRMAMEAGTPFACSDDGTLGSSLDKFIINGYAIRAFDTLEEADAFVDEYISSGDGENDWKR